MTEPTDAPGDRRPGLSDGTRVEVRSGFDGSWDSGFVVHQGTESGYLLRRDSDDQVLPVEFPARDVRRERKHAMWWI